MIAAMVEVARERGAGQVTVAHIVARSGVSRRTFYEVFEDREDCFLAAFDEAVERAAARVLPAFHAGGAWRERIRAGLDALLEFLEDEPSLGGFCMVDALSAGAGALERRAQVVDALIGAVDEGRGETEAGLKPTRLTAEGVVGAVLGVLYARLVRASAGSQTRSGAANGRRPGGGVQPVTGLLGPLMGIVVLPYQGQAVASREAARPAPRRRRAGPPRGDPLRDLDMRLTYRTVRVLLAIASNRGASNRAVADASGVSDQGQISKLLARLEQLGLVQNRSGGSVRGEPNAWRLTPKGEEIERTIRRSSVTKIRIEKLPGRS
jgi:AcrR family transcriptional regulator/DNA-binding MarR family transcriptional regulator